MSACHGLDRADEVYGLRGERDPTAGGAPSLVELDVWIAHRRTGLQRAGNGGGDDRSVDRTSTLVGAGISAGQWLRGAHVSDDTLVCVLDAGMGAKPRWLCRKVAILRQNAKFVFRKNNNLRAATFLFSIICDRALRSSWKSFSRWRGKCVASNARSPCQ